MTKVYIGNVGVRLLVDTQTDISAADTLALKVEYPDGTTASWAGTAFDSTTIQYVTEANDLLVSGRYEIQSYVVIDSGSWRGETAPLYVHALFQ